MQTMTIQLRGQPTQVTHARYLEILAAERRLEVCRALKRLANEPGEDADRLRASLRRELAELGQVAA